MNKKIIIVSIVILLVICVGIGMILILNKENQTKQDEKKYEQSEEQKENTTGKYYIKVRKNYIPGGNLELEMDSAGKFKIIEINFSSAVDVKTTENTYSGKLTEKEFEKIKYILNYVKENSDLDIRNGYEIYVDENTNDTELSYENATILEDTLSAIASIARDNEKLEEGRTRREFGNEFLDYIIEDIKISETPTEEYKKIEFTKYEVVAGEEISIKKGKKSNFEIRDKVVIIDDVETDIETDFDKIYVVDVDEDGTNEIISCTTYDMISPPTNYYNIYKLNDDEKFEEVLHISIMGTIDEIYVKGKQIRIEYEPYEAKPGTIVKEDYTIK